MSLRPFLPLGSLGRSLALDERGFVISAELVLLLTLGVLAGVVGINAVAKSINNELSDVAGAFGSMNQSYTVTGFANLHGNAWTSPFGHGFADRTDACDFAPIVATGELRASRAAGDRRLARRGQRRSRPSRDAIPE